MRLSAWKYIRNNKKTVGVLTISLALSFMVMYLVYILLISGIESMKPMLLEQPKHVSYLDISGETYGLKIDDFETEEAYKEAYNEKTDELIEKLKNTDGIENAYYRSYIPCKLDSLAGSGQCLLPLLEPEEIPGFLEHMNATLLEGELPKGEGEVLVDKTILKNNNLKVGDWLNKDWFGETFIVTGVIDSDCLISVGTPRGGSNAGWSIVILNDENVTDLNIILSDLGITLGEDDVASDLVRATENFEEFDSNVINTAINVIEIIVIIFLAISVLVAYISFMRNRINEYCLYASIGYGRADIYGMIMREMLIIFGMGTVVGIILSLSAAYIIYGTILEPMGLITNLIAPDHIGKLLSSYVFIMGLLQIPVLISISSVRTIDAIEDK